MDSRLTIFRRTWFQILISGLVIFAIIFAAYIVTEIITLLPAVILVGSFLIPAVFVVYLFERLHARELPLYTLALTFFWGGAFGIAVAGLLQYWAIVALDVLPLVLVSVVEEAAKLIFPVIIYIRARYALERDGVLIGVASGMGFAAFETMGYGLSAALADGPGFMGATLLLRGLISPAAHAAWTGYVAAVMWLEHSKRGRPAFTGSIVWAFVVAILLHTAWNTFALVAAQPGIGALLVSFIGLIIVAGLSLGLLFWRIRQSERRAREKGVDRDTRKDSEEDREE